MTGIDVEIHGFINYIFGRDGDAVGDHILSSSDWMNFSASTMDVNGSNVVRDGMPAYPGYETVIIVTGYFDTGYDFNIGEPVCLWAEVDSLVRTSIWGIPTQSG